MTPPAPRRRPAADHVGFEELAVGYALHALEPEDELRFGAHLAGCTACAAAVAEHEETLAGLAESSAAEPPPSVLEGIRAGVAASGRRSAPELPPVLDLDLARRRRAAVVVRRSWLLSGAAAVMVVVLGLGAWNTVLRGDLDEQQERTQTLAATVEALETRDARTVQLADFDGDVQAVVIAHGQQMSLVVDGLEANEEDTVYVLWGQTASGEVRALSTFDVATDRLDVLNGMPLQLPLEELDALMVTQEQGRTPPEQTQQPVLVAGSV